MKTVIRISQVIVIMTAVLFVVPRACSSKVKPGEIGVRQSATSGVDTQDFGPGRHLTMPGVHSMITLPSGYFFLDYAEGTELGALSIRTRDNNTLRVDVTVAVRIRNGEAHKIVRAGNHTKDGARYRYQRLAGETVVSVLREELAKLDPANWYKTDLRIETTLKALEMLNAALEPLHLEAQSVLIREFRFTDQYEKQLTQIQLNVQNKLLDAAKQGVAAKQQTLDNYQQGTAAQAAAKQQDWVKRQSVLERSYQNGLLAAEESTPGAARIKLASLTPEQVLALRTEAATIFGLDSPDSVTDAYLIGIKNLEAETLEYRNRVRAEADGQSARLMAEGDAMVAKVQGEYETKLNALLSTPAGRAYVAYNAAANIQFAQTLTFSSNEGIPSVLRLRRFAEQFMGGP